jgi:hypothetical protein
MMANFFYPIRLHDIGPRFTTYLDVPKKVVSNSKNRSPPLFSKKSPTKNIKKNIFWWGLIFAEMSSKILKFIKTSNFLKIPIKN